jgi:hypothetical protein
MEDTFYTVPEAKHSRVATTYFEGDASVAGITSLDVFQVM